LFTFIFRDDTCVLNTVSFGCKHHQTNGLAFGGGNWKHILRRSLPIRKPPARHIFIIEATLTATNVDLSRPSNSCLLGFRSSPSPPNYQPPTRNLDHYKQIPRLQGQSCEEISLSGLELASFQPRQPHLITSKERARHLRTPTTL
jgi:hypothetical protein